MDKSTIRDMKDWPNRHDEPNKPPEQLSEQAQPQAENQFEALLLRQHSRSKSEPQSVKAKLTQDNLAALNRQMESKMSSKGEIKPKSQSQSAASDAFITAEEQVEGNKTGHQLMSFEDFEKDWHDRNDKMTKEEQEAESNKYFDPESLAKAKKGVSPSVVMAYLMGIEGSI
ncbi:hypothetical protein ACHAO9_009583 [Fusarium lateritium]